MNMRKIKLSAQLAQAALLGALVIAGCQSFEDPVTGGPDAPSVGLGPAEENPAQPVASEQYRVAPPANAPVIEVNEANDLDPILNDPTQPVTVFEEEEPAL